MYCTTALPVDEKKRPAASTLTLVNINTLEYLNLYQVFKLLREMYGYMKIPSGL